MRDISIIVAKDKNNAIGKDDKLLVHLPKDLKMFKDKTINNIIIMGRKTFQSIGKALPNRINIIITRDKDFVAENCLIFNSIDDAIESLENNYLEKEIFIIGGGEIYKQVLLFVNKLYITEIDNIFPEANIFFPDIDMNDWIEINRIHNIKDDIHKYDFDFVEYERK